MIIQGQKKNLPIKQKLRKELTPAERKLWSKIRANQINGLKFRRQHGVGPYIVDFYCPARTLVIEVDGDVHAKDEQLKKDRSREEFLQNLGLTIIRYQNNDILNNLEGVLEDLYERTK